MIDFLKNNYTWLFSGIGVTILIAIYYILKPSKKDKSEVLNENSEYLLNTGHNFTVNNFTTDNGTRYEHLAGDDQLDYAKKTVRILFIDDDTKFKVVTILKKSGWINTKAVKDIDSWDSQDVKETDIFLLIFKELVFY